MSNPEQALLVTGMSGPDARTTYGVPPMDTVAAEHLANQQLGESLMLPATR